MGEIGHPAALARYVAFVVLAVAGPGLGAFGALRLPAVPSLVLPLGWVLCAACYRVALALDRPWLAAVPLLALDVVAVATWRRGRSPDAARPREAVLAVLAAASLVAFVRGPGNRIDDRGRFVVDPMYAADVAFRVGVTWELVAGAVPQVPGLSGVPLAYHVGPELARAAAWVLAAVHPYDALSRGEPLLGVAALALVLVDTARLLRAPVAVVRLAPWVPLLTDLSWLLAFRPPSTTFWVEVMAGTLLVSVVTGNGMMPGLALGLAALIATGRAVADAGGRLRWTLLAMVLGCALPHFKVFVAALLAGGLAVALPGVPIRGPAAAVLGATLASTGLLLLGGHAVETVEVALDPFERVWFAARFLDASPQGFGETAAAVVAWTVGSLGLRVVGLAGAARAAFRGDLPARALGAIALAGWPLALLVRIAPKGHETRYNEVFYFQEAAGTVLWLFALGAVASAAREGRRWIWGLAAVACVPATLQFGAAARRLPDVEDVPPEVVRAMEALARDGAPGDVVLQRAHPRYPPPPMVLVGRRVPYTRTIPYLSQFAPSGELERRLECVRRFFATGDPREAAGIARHFGARYVALYRSDAVSFPLEDVLAPVHVEGKVALYRVRPDAAPGPAPCAPLL